MAKMRFARDMFYNDPHKPLYDAGKVYEVEAHMVDRWLKRGGELVVEILETPEEVLEEETDEGELESDSEKADDKPKRRGRPSKNART